MKGYLHGSKLEGCYLVVRLGLGSTGVWILVMTRVIDEVVIDMRVKDDPAISILVYDYTVFRYGSRPHHDSITCQYLVNGEDVKDWRVK